MERTRGQDGDEISLQTVIGDRTWHKVVNLTKIQMLNLFGWCAFDSDFHPNRTDWTFKSWAEKGLTTYLSFTKK